MNVCIIPARGGSKRIPRKNILDFCGKPIIAWSIEAAQKSECFDEILVSTDDSEIMEVSRALGATCPFQRPADLADDFTGTAQVIAHAVQFIVDLGRSLDAVCCLYATAPFVLPLEIRQALNLLSKVPEDGFVFTATPYLHPIQRSLKLNLATGKAQMLYPEYLNSRSQDLEKAFCDAGQFYWGRPQAWLTNYNIFEGSHAFVIPRARAIDINSPEDWEFAEAVFLSTIL
jgi:pseudaminic acid cytidylyltransferase